MQICGWEDITHVFSATGRIPGSAFAPVLEKMENAWSPEAREEGLPKRSINCMIGIMAMQTNTEALSVVSGGPADGAGHWAMKEFTWKEKTIIDWVHNTQLKDNHSYRPLHDFIMASEHVAVAQAYYWLKRLQIPFQVLDVKTDALNLLVAHRHISKVKEVVCSVAYQDLHKSLNLFEKAAVPLHPRPGAGPVFRFKPHGKRLQGQYRTPRKDAAPPQPLASWAQLSEAQALEAAMAGERWRWEE
jgi:hypothetical protein